MNIGFAIKTVRSHFHFSQEELSEKTGISQTSISQIENAIKSPSKKSIAKICEALDIPEAVLYIIGFEDTDVPNSRKDMFHSLYPSIKDLAMQIVGEESRKVIQQ